MATTIERGMLDSSCVAAPISCSWTHWRKRRTGAITCPAPSTSSPTTSRRRHRGGCRTDRTVVVYCGSAKYKRSAKAVARLERLGYTDVREYVEGRQDWQAAGLPLEAGADPVAPS